MMVAQSFSLSMNTEAYRPMEVANPCVKQQEEEHSGDVGRIGNLTPTNDVEEYSATTTANDDDNGWHQIDVFYGERDPKMLTKRSGGWFAQIQQDFIVYNLLEQKKGGYFIDLAANDATFISNTYALETFYGWNGVCIEPNTKFWARLAYRKCAVVGAVIGSTRMESLEYNFGPKEKTHVQYSDGSDGDKSIHVGGAGIVSNNMDNKPHWVKKNNETVIKRYTVPIREILERQNVPKIIDYFSLDVEGAEGYIMSKFPFDEYHIRILTVERPKQDLKDLLAQNNYKFVGDVGIHGEKVYAHTSEMDQINKIRESGKVPQLKN